MPTPLQAALGEPVAGSLRITGVELCGRTGHDVRLARGRVAEIGPNLEPWPGERRLQAHGGALLPGLHDHHLHLFAWAAARTSLRCGPPAVRDLEGLAAVLAGVPPGRGWLRGVGYHESVAGPLDRQRLDPLSGRRPLRIQHRSGALWMLNSAAVDALALDHGVDAPGVERGPDGRATGRLFHLDGWLRERLGSHRFPSLAEVGRWLARRGVTGVTDAGAGNGPAELDALRTAVERGELPQRVVVMGGLSLPASPWSAVERGAVKVMLRDADLPAPEALEELVAEARGQERALAIHCVTRAELVFALSALLKRGARPGDRIEHASLAAPDLVAQLAELGLTVVTQPNFVRERGDAYRVDVDASEHPWLYRGRAFLSAGIPLAAGTDAPFGEPDPWRAMQAAVDRRTAGGELLGPAEALTPEQALALFTSPAERPGAPARRVAPGAPADLCLLDRPWAEARRALDRVEVAATFRAGEPSWRAASC